MAQQLRLNQTPDQALASFGNLLRQRGAKIVGREPGSLRFGLTDDAAGSVQVTAHADGGANLTVEATSLALIAIVDGVVRELRRAPKGASAAPASPSTSPRGMNVGFSNLRERLGMPPPEPAPAEEGAPDGAPRQFTPRPSGPRPDGQRFQGPRPSGPRFVGPRPDGAPTDGSPRPDGPRFSGPRPSGPRFGGPRPAGAPADGSPRPDGPRFSGPRPSGPRAEGQRFQGPRPDGPRFSGPRTAPSVVPTEAAAAESVAPVEVVHSDAPHVEVHAEVMHAEAHADAPHAED
ncbi:MAG: hypothetical protein EB140_13885, partial [Proteobacteria bacterium]|nr:hypothetical protein [Pseudomonadota bacterium]